MWCRNSTNQRGKNMSFKFNFTKEHLAAMIPGNPKVDQWFAALVAILPKYGIHSERRVAHFISQCAHESNNFRALEENLNYSADALARVFPRYFGAGKRNPNDYARNPEKIANYVYQDEFRSVQGRMGNVNPGDGWLFRGRGLKQLTGRNNYTAFGKFMGMSAEEAAVYVATEKGAIESACWFWDTNKLNAIADTDDVVLMTRRINGGNIGLDDRQQRYTRAMQILGGPAPVAAAAPAVNMNETVRVGSKGETVKAVQAKLGLTADGAFGPGTERAVKAWQAANGLTADGIVGPKTLAKLLG
jgi:putative chitinase